MNKAMKTAAAFAAVMMVSGPAAAAELCGAKVAVEGNTTVAKFGTMSAACEQDSICSVSLANTKSARADVERASLDGSWLVKFSSTSSIDSGAGVDLVFNGDDETRVAPEFLITSEDHKNVRVDDDVSQIVVSTMLEAKSVAATVQFIGGKKVELGIDLSHLKEAFKWTDCAQAKK